MNKSRTVILFDLISTQGPIINGGAEFTVKILQTILKRYNKDYHKIIFLFDSKIQTPYTSANPRFLEDKYNFTCVDLAKSESIASIIDEYKVDLFFVGIGQRLEYYSLENINCKTYIVFHDLSNIEIEDNWLEYFLFMKLHKKTLKHFLRLILSYFSLRKPQGHHYINPFKFALNENVTIFTVSEYSKISIKYYFPEIKKEISVIHSPEKHIYFKKEISNEILKNLIESRAKYFLILGADRPLKNVDFTKLVFGKFSVLYPEFILVNVGKQCKSISNQINLPYLSESDLEHAFKNCYSLIYATIFEGFGYPPIEAMKYGKPIIASNVCSMPELLGDAPIYFSPFYKVDLMKALLKVVCNYDYYKNKSILKYQEIKELQNTSLDRLVSMILNSE